MHAEREIRPPLTTFNHAPRPIGADAGSPIVSPGSDVPRGGSGNHRHICTPLLIEAEQAIWGLPVRTALQVGLPYLVAACVGICFGLLLGGAVGFVAYQADSEPPVRVLRAS
jgi:hypothetical protein